MTALANNMKGGQFFVMSLIAAFFTVTLANDTVIVADKSYLTTTVLKVREKPDLKSKQLDTLQKGESVYILEVAGQPTKVGNKTARWGLIEYVLPGKPRVKGYVYLGFLEEDSTNTGAGADDPGPNPLWGCNEIRNFEYSVDAGFDSCTRQDFAKLRELAKKNPKKSQSQILDIYDKKGCTQEFKTAEMNCGFDLNEKR